jgi:hypothetical protein
MIVVALFNSGFTLFTFRTALRTRGKTLRIFELTLFTSRATLRTPLTTKKAEYALIAPPGFCVSLVINALI